MDLEALRKKAEYLRSLGYAAIADDYEMLIDRLEELETSNYTEIAKKREWE